MFNVSSGIDMNVLAVIPCAILGCIGGALGAGFTFFNLKIVRLRRRIYASVGKTSERLVDLIKIAEPVLILVVTVTVSVFVPAAFGCTEFSCTVPKSEVRANLVLHSPRACNSVDFEAPLKKECPFS